MTKSMISDWIYFRFEHSLNINEHVMYASTATPLRSLHKSTDLR